MNRQKAVLETRPFRSLFKAARELLILAKHCEQPGQPKKRRALERSLSISAFILKYAALEAFVNCVYREFGLREIGDLSQDYFEGKLKDNRKKMRRIPFEKCPLAARVFLLVPICSDPEIDPRQVFDINCRNWKEFEETICIRNSYSHPTSQKVKFDFGEFSRGEWPIEDSNPENFWPLTQIRKDHWNFNIDAALELNHTLDWVVNSIRFNLKDKIDATFMVGEVIKLL